MNQKELVARIEILEQKMKRIETKLEGASKALGKQASEFFGMFHNDPYFEAAMKAGAAWRGSFRPKAQRKRRRKK